MSEVCLILDYTEKQIDVEMMVCVTGDSDVFVFGGIISIHLNLLLAAAGDVQAYQIRAAPASTIAPGVVMASSPALPTQGATEEVTRKREVRLMKNRYCKCLSPLV